MKSLINNIFNTKWKNHQTYKIDNIIGNQFFFIKGIESSILDKISIKCLGDGVIAEDVSTYIYIEILSKQVLTMFNDYIELTATKHANDEIQKLNYGIDRYGDPTTVSYLGYNINKKNNTIQIFCTYNKLQDTTLKSIEMHADYVIDLFNEYVTDMMEKND